MSKLEALIAELCPEGVKYKTLGEIATITRGGNLQKKDFCNEGFPCIHYGQIYTKYGLFTDKALTFISNETAKKQKLAEQNDIIMAVTSENVEDVCKCVVWLGIGKVAVSGHTAIIHHNQNAKYLAYFFHSSLFFVQKTKLAHGTKVIEVTPDKLNGIRIPIPPIEIQREIVHILDSFTELTAELTAELIARKQQYEYYRNQLLCQKENNFSSSKLSEIADIYDGTHQTPEYKSEGIPFISVENIDNIYASTKFISKDDFAAYKIKPQIGDLFMTRIGSIGKCATMTHSSELAYYVSLALIRPKQSVLNVRYLKHYIESIHGAKELAKRTLQNAVPIKINKDDIGKIIIKYPSLEIQTKIANILDNFDTICSDLNIGLPAEIEARQKQYKYYRDKLLTFVETGEGITRERERERERT